VDITERPDAAVKYRVMATPALAINGKLEFMGVPKEEALRARLREARDR
jgi:protein-disulfide isomerase